MNDSRFARDTALRTVSEGVYEFDIDPGWWIVAGPNGGYLSALLLRGMQHTVADPARPPRSFTVHFTERAEAGPARLLTRVERAGRSLSTVTARMEQADRTLAIAIAAFSRSRPGAEFQEQRAPDAAPPESLPPRDGAGPSESPFRRRFETRPLPGNEPFSGAAEARSGGWIRPAEPYAADAPLLVALCDSWPPAVFARLERPFESRGAPTIDLTVHFRAPLDAASSEPGAWFLGQWRTRCALDGFLEEDGQIWSRDGRLLAQSRQLAIFA